MPRSPGALAGDIERLEILDASGEADPELEPADPARWGETSREPLRGRCISVTNVGGVGGDYFTPIINDPEAAILGVGALREVPALVRDDEGVQHLQARLERPLILAFDHRLNDGVDVARFTNAIADALADPERLLLAA